MSTAKKQLVLDALNNRKTDRVPVGFWFHFTEGDEVFQGLEDPSIIIKNIQGHEKFYRSFQPDFVKLMSDGFFRYPNAALTKAKHASDLKSLRPLVARHPWIEKQIDLAKSLTDSFGKEVLTFYNIFSPATFFKFLFGDGEAGNKALANFLNEDPEAVRHALDVIAEDLSILASRVISEGGTDGIYLSVQNIQDKRISKETYRHSITPSEKKVLASANASGENNILHICGYEGTRNDLTTYADYDAKAFNWAVTVEGVSLGDGKKIFGDKAVIGGFASSKGSLLHAGSKEEIQNYTAKVLEHAGTRGVILGGDCTVPSDIDLNRLDWVRQNAAAQKRI